MGKSIEEQREAQRRLSYEGFDLLKFKITKDGVDVDHHESGPDGGTYTKKGEAQPHPDLLEKMEQLKLYMASRIGLLEGWDFSRDKIKGNLENTKLAKEGHDDAVARCKPGGLTFTGSGETAGVIITGSFLVPKGGSIGVSVAKITFGKETLGYEDDVENICEELKREVYAYRFQGKKHQSDINTEIEKKKNPDLFKVPDESPKKGKAKTDKKSADEKAKLK